MRFLPLDDELWLRTAAITLLVCLAVVPQLAVAALATSTATEALAFFILFVASTALSFALPTLVWTAWLQAFLTPIAIFWVGFVWLFGAAPHTATFYVLWTTPAAEVATWIDSRRPIAVIALCICAISVGVASLLFKSKRSPSIGQDARRASLAVGLLAVMFVLVWQSTETTLAKQQDDAVEVAMRTAWPSGMLLAAAGLSSDIGDRSSQANRSALTDPVRPLPFMPQLDDAAKQGMLIVFVIGESHRSDVMSPVSRPDLAPGLKRWVDAGQLVEFTDVASASNLTIYSVPAMITGTPSDRLLSGVHRKPSGLGFFSKAGFFTAWLSNQADSAFAEEGWSVASFPPSDRYVSHDEILLSQLRQVLAFNHRHKAVVLHMMGSHFDYERRYPSTFRPVPSAALAKRDYVRQNYENSVAYSADILDRVLQVTLSTPFPAVVIFSSDHGENLLDDERQLIWHGGVVPPSRVEFSAATWIAWNESWSSAFPQLASQLRTISRYPLSHEHLLGIWLTIGGLLDSDGARPMSVMKAAARELPNAGDRLVFHAGRTARLRELR